MKNWEYKTEHTVIDDFNILPDEFERLGGVGWQAFQFRCLGSRINGWSYQIYYKREKKL